MLLLMFRDILMLIHSWPCNVTFVFCIPAHVSYFADFSTPSTITLSLLQSSIHFVCHLHTMIKDSFYSLCRNQKYIYLSYFQLSTSLSIVSYDIWDVLKLFVCCPHHARINSPYLSFISVSILIFNAFSTVIPVLLAEYLCFSPCICKFSSFKPITRGRDGQVCNCHFHMTF